MTESRAVNDVIAAETRTHQLLKEIRLLIAAFGGAETGQGLLTMGVANFRQCAARKVQRFIPRGFPKYLQDIVGVHDEIGALRCIIAPDQWHGEPLGMARIVKAVTPLDAKTRVISRAVAAIDVQNLVIFDVIGELTAHAAIRTQRIDGPIRLG